ncbi:hypothetical protein OF83DRAFT_387187 [Amylostereum chailletii]|nr:hypothetical protein OF83DRAFT_387187 [Amylostereum chailletii]
MPPPCADGVGHSSRMARRIVASCRGQVNHVGVSAYVSAVQVSKGSFRGRATKARLRRKGGGAWTMCSKQRAKMG